MLDVRRIRAEPEKVREGIADKGETADLDRWLELDTERRALRVEWEGCRAELNAGGGEIARARKEGRDPRDAVAKLGTVKARGKELHARIAELEAELEEIFIRIPNLPSDESPRGPDDSGNVEVARWGEPVALGFPPRPHWEIGAGLGILDIEAGARIAGSGFPVLKGAGARLERALIQFMLDLHTREHGYVEVAPPHVSRPESMVACGQIPKLEADMYRCRDDDLYLIPTGEVPLTNLHRGEILAGEDLPLHYVTMTPCYRREAGAAGRDTRGLIRVHQFHKVELMSFLRPEDSGDRLLALRSHGEEVLRRLGLHYRVLELCTGDLSFAGHRGFDLEAWCPGIDRFLEVSTATGFADFQARRANTRFRDEDGGLHFVHTLNGSALAVGRTLIAVLETYQREDGGFDVPEALAPHMDGATRIPEEGGR